MAGDIASVIGDTMHTLKAKVAHARVAADRGNLPTAESMLEESIQNAKEGGFTELLALALHERGTIALRRGDTEKAIKCTYEAFSMYKDPVSRDRALADMAATFFKMGLLSAARDADLLLVAMAQEQYTRWVASINLLEIAAMDEREPVFEQYRRELASVQLPAVLSAHYHFYVGQGFRRFERNTQAKAALERAIGIASKNQINEVLFKAEQSLSEIRDGGVIIVAEAAEPSPAVSEIAGAIREMRTLAGVAG
jgi:tetratricopeptide (TPR) repeat protein